MRNPTTLAARWHSSAAKQWRPVPGVRFQQANMVSVPGTGSPSMRVVTQTRVTFNGTQRLQHTETGLPISSPETVFSRVSLPVRRSCAVPPVPSLINMAWFEDSFGRGTGHIDVDDVRQGAYRLNWSSMPDLSACIEHRRRFDQRVYASGGQLL